MASSRSSARPAQRRFEPWSRKAAEPLPAVAVLLSILKAPALRSGFAALYRALGLPVVPIAVDSGRLWGRGFVHRSGTITFKVGSVIPAGLSRKDVEARVHAAINVLESGAEARS